MIHKRNTALELSVKQNIFNGGLKLVSQYQLHPLTGTPDVLASRLITLLGTLHTL